MTGAPSGRSRQGLHLVHGFSRVCRSVPGNRVGIGVGDLARPLEFYRDLIGLPVVNEVETSLIGKGRMVRLGYGNSLIKLVRLEQAPAAPPPGGVSAALGLRYVTLLVAEIGVVTARLERAGTPVSAPLNPARQRRADRDD